MFMRATSWHFNLNSILVFSDLQVSILLEYTGDYILMNLFICHALPLIVIDIVTAAISQHEYNVNGHLLFVREISLS